MLTGKSHANNKTEKLASQGHNVIAKWAELKEFKPPFLTFLRFR